MPRQIKIISEGTVTTTKVYTPSGREMIGLIEKMVITVDANDPHVRAKIDVILPELDMDISAKNVRLELKELEKEGAILTKPCVKCGEPMEYNTDHELCIDCAIGDTDGHSDL